MSSTPLHGVVQFWSRVRGLGHGLGGVAKVSRVSGFRGSGFLTSDCFLGCLHPRMPNIP